MRIVAVLTIATFALAGAAWSAAPAAAGPNCSAGTSIDTQEQRMLELINDHRADHGVGPLALSNTLTKAATWKAQHMAGNDYFAHDDPGTGRDFVDRIRDCGYGYNTWLGENIAAGHESAEETFDQWRNSPGHNANMLNDDYNAIGISRAYHQDSTYEWYWVTDFGGHADGAPPPPAPPPGSTPERSGDANCTATTDSVDAALVLQFNAGLLNSLACEDEADVNADDAIDALDATLILQIAAGLLA